MYIHVLQFSLGALSKITMHRHCAFTPNHDLTTTLPRPYFILVTVRY